MLPYIDWRSINWTQTHKKSLSIKSSPRLAILIVNLETRADLARVSFGWHRTDIDFILANDDCWPDNWQVNSINFMMSSTANIKKKLPLYLITFIYRWKTSVRELFYFIQLQYQQSLYISLKNMHDTTKTALYYLKLSPVSYKYTWTVWTCDLVWRRQRGGMDYSKCNEDDQYTTHIHFH